MMLCSSSHAFLVLIAGFILHFVHLPPPNSALTGSRPVRKNVALAGDVPADLLLRHLSVETDRPQCPVRPGRS